MRGKSLNSYLLNSGFNKIERVCIKAIAESPAGIEWFAEMFPRYKVFPDYKPQSVSVSPQFLFGSGPISRMSSPPFSSSDASK